MIQNLLFVLHDEDLHQENCAVLHRPRDVQLRVVQMTLNLVQLLVVNCKDQKIISRKLNLNSNETNRVTASSERFLLRRSGLKLFGTGDSCVTVIVVGTRPLEAS